MLIAPKTYISIMIQNLQMKIHPKMVIGLQGIIPGGGSIKDFSAVTKMSSDDSKIILDEFIKSEIGTKQDESYYFEDGDKLKIGGKNDIGKASVSCKKVAPLKITPINIEK